MLQNDPGMDAMGLQGMIDNLPQTVDTTFASNLNSPAVDFGMPKATGNYFNGSTDMYGGIGGGSLVNSAICNRAPDFVLDQWCSDFELARTHAADLAPEYDAVGEYLGIAPIPEEVLAAPVNGANLVPGSLRDQLGSGDTLLVFLRHFGCMFCRETLADMRAISEKDARFPEPLFFFQGSATEGRAFLRRYWPQLRAISDPEGEFYRGFGIRRGGPLKMLGPAVWAAKSRAEAKGHRNGPRSGDIWRMPGLFLARGSRIVWAHEYRHAADHPDYERICEIAAAAS